MKHKVKHLHFVGIGGSGMSGIAEVLLNLGFQVSGSDLSENAVTQRLRQLGATVYLGHAEQHLTNADAVVVSTAVGEDNPEVLAARARRIPVVPRAMMLAELMRLRQGIAVAGTHGKTTTTSLAASMLAKGGFDPTFVIGGRLNSSGGNARLGTGEFIVAEADESDASFLHLQPIIAVITNIDADHMETYGHDFGRLKQAFVDFVEHLPFYGMAMLCIDDANVREILPHISKPVCTYGFSEDAMIRAVNVRHQGGQMRFTAECRQNGTPKDLDITLNLAGMHNVLNALAAIAIGLEICVADDAIIAALAEFEGVGRRFQRYGDIPLPNPLPPTGEGTNVAASAGGSGSFTLIDDYGHHPAEMAATLAAVRGAFPGRRLVLAFQPHRYTRTRDLFEDFVKVLCGVDALALAEVYAAGEPPIVAADGRALMHALRVAGQNEAVFVEQVAEMPQAIMQMVRDGDVVITMGAGSIGGVPGMLAHAAEDRGQRTEDRGFVAAARQSFDKDAAKPLNTLSPVLCSLSSELRGELRCDASMNRHTSWRAGGIAERMYQPADLDDLLVFLRQLPPEEPLHVVGLGSNLLVRDGGLRGTVLLLHGALGGLRLEADGSIYAEAGVPGAKLARFAALHNLRGAEFFAGIPGTVGGMLAMNAGCYGSETWEKVLRVLVATRSGELLERTAEDYEIGYRHVTRIEDRGSRSELPSPACGRGVGGEGQSSIPDPRSSDEFFVAARLKFEQGDGRVARQEIKELLSKRSASQPLNLPNAGSVFRNPSGDHAARLIQQCGLKGRRIGGAQVSEKHANFIVNTGGATAADIENLINEVQATVEQQTGVKLQCEVRIVGEAA